MTSDILSVDELLARSAAAAKSRAATGPQSAVQKLLAQRDAPTEDTVDLSPVARLVKQQAAANPKKEPFTESEQFIRAKVQQLRFQLDFYSRLGGELGNNAINSIEAEIRGLLKKQSDRIKASEAEAAAKQKQLDEANAEKNLFAGLPTADQMLKRSQARLRGEDVEPFAPPSDADKAKDAAVQKLLDAARKKVDLSA